MFSNESRDVEKGNPKTQWFKIWKKKKNYIPRQKSPVDDTLWINRPFPGPGTVPKDHFTAARHGSSPWRKPWSSVPCLFHKRFETVRWQTKVTNWGQHSQNQPKFGLFWGGRILRLDPMSSDSSPVWIATMIWDYKSFYHTVVIWADGLPHRIHVAVWIVIV